MAITRSTLRTRIRTVIGDSSSHLISDPEINEAIKQAIYETWAWSWLDQEVEIATTVASTIEYAISQTDLMAPDYFYRVSLEPSSSSQPYMTLYGTRVVNDGGTLYLRLGETQPADRIIRGNYRTRHPSLSADGNETEAPEDWVINRGAVLAMQNRLRHASRLDVQNIQRLMEILQGHALTAKRRGYMQPQQTRIQHWRD